MSRTLVFAGAVLMFLSPTVAAAQSGGGRLATGAATGAIGGAIVGGPIGAAIGAIGGAIVGGISEGHQQNFRQDVVSQDSPSHSYARDVRVGTVLPQSGIVYHEMPAEYNVHSRRYTVVNETPVLVDPRTGRIVQVIR
jgi:hypothetical protein